MSSYCAGIYSEYSCRPVSRAVKCNSNADCGAQSECIFGVPVYKTTVDCMLGTDHHFDCAGTHATVGGGNPQDPIGHINVCSR